MLAGLGNAGAQFFKENGVANSGALLVTLNKAGIAQEPEQLIQIMTAPGTDGTVASPSQILAHISPQSGNQEYLNLFRLATLRTIRQTIEGLGNDHPVKTSEWAMQTSLKILRQNGNNPQAAIKAVDELMQQIQ